MKYSSRVLSLLALVSMVVFFAGCDKGDDNKKSTTDQQIEKLKGTWEATSVTYQSSEQADYADFTIKLTGDNGADGLDYTITGRPSGKIGPWPASGTLDFGSPVTSQFIRSGDGLEIEYQLTGATVLTLSFNYTGEGEMGRVDEIGGDWVFTLQKQ
jgi:hypothetical protein